MNAYNIDLIFNYKLFYKIYFKQVLSSLTYLLNNNFCFNVIGTQSGTYVILLFFFFII